MIAFLPTEVQILASKIFGDFFQANHTLSKLIAKKNKLTHVSNPTIPNFIWLHPKMKLLDYIKGDITAMTVNDTMALVVEVTLNTFKK